jgi:hypothetical protein
VGRREDIYISVMHEHLEAVIGRRLRRLDEQSHSGPSHDFETSDGAIPLIAIEAKELVSGDLLATRSQVGRANSYLSSILEFHWVVSYSEPTLGSWYDPKSWSESNRGKLAEIKLGRLYSELEKQLIVLERFGIRNSRSRDGGSVESASERAELMKAQLAISQLLDGVCLCSTATKEHPPGFDIAFSYNYVRTGKPDVVVERVQSWLDGSLSENLLDSLLAFSGGERHAALWLATDPECESASEQGRKFLPTVELKMPDPIDALWVFLPPVVWRYDGMWTVTIIE